MIPGRTAFDRPTALSRLADEHFDVLVIGGGVTGAGVALDSAARGLRTALVERHDFASGTSSRSSKLVHGGLRYLQQREYRLVRENLAERQLLLRNAPHLVKPLPFLIPLFGSDGVVDRTVARAYGSALWAYDLSGGMRIGHRHRRITADEVVSHMPALDPRGVRGGFIYYDAQADDARLTLCLARTAVIDHGATAANHSPVAALLGSGEAGAPVTGARLVDGTEVRASVVVNATGVWSDEIAAMEKAPHSRSIRPAKGTHLSVDRSALPCDMAAVVPVQGSRRSIFVVPWGDRVYLGTTDTDYDGPLDDPVCTPEDVRYLLGAVNAVVSQPLRASDVTGTWAGLRPLVRDERRLRTADLSRRHRVSVSSGGLVSVTGGKLTTYRKMAEDTVDEVVRRLHRSSAPCPTAALALRGGEGLGSLERPGSAVALGVEPPTLAHLLSRYGSEARTVAAMVKAAPDLARPLVPGLPYLRAEAVYAVRYEMARTVEDVLARRTRARPLAAAACAAAAGDVARLLAPELGWDDAAVERQVATFRADVERERVAAGLSGDPAGEPAQGLGPGTGG